MKNGLLIACTSVLSAGLVYIFDPTNGRRRRVVFRDQFMRRMRDLGDFADVSKRDIKNRTMGLYGEARYHIRGKNVADDQLVERVRSKLGHYISHPKAVTISANDGTVTLSGIAFNHEVRKAIRTIQKIPGVHSVRDNLKKYPAGANIPALQGGMQRSKHSVNLLQDNWSPATRVLAGTAGASLAYDGMKRSKYFMASEVVLGFGLLLRSFVNQPMKQVIAQGKIAQGSKPAVRLAATMH